jgi:hypothetical protein
MAVHAEAVGLREDDDGAGGRGDELIMFLPAMQALHLKKSPGMLSM